MRFADLVRVLDTTAPLSIAAAWDHSGIQVATRRGEISRLAVCLDPLPCHLASALEQGAEMILSHHPLALEPRLPRAGAPAKRGAARGVRGAWGGG